MMDLRYGSVGHIIEISDEGITNLEKSGRIIILEKTMNWKELQNITPQVIQAECDATPEEVNYAEERLEVLNRHIQSLIDEKMIVSGSYCLWRHGKVFADAALGNLAREWHGRTKFMPDTLFEIQSITKVFVALAILKLAEDGILYLRQPVHEWIDEFDADEFRDITIVQLLTHTSGLCALPGILADDDRIWWKAIDEERVKETWISAAVNAGLHAKPGEKWIYSAVGFPILGEIIERATGIKMDQFIRENIIIPCDMTETHWRIHTTEEWIKRYNIANSTELKMASEYEKIGLKALARPSYRWWKEVPDASGGIVSTSREMVKLGEMMLRDGCYRGRRVIGKTALSYLWTNLVGDHIVDSCWGHPDLPVRYGAGMSISTHNTDLEQILSENVILHEGSGTSVFMVDRQEDFVAMFQMSFPEENGWNHKAVKGTASIIWSGIQ